MNVKTLIIDDEQDICFLLSMLLKRQNFDVRYVMSIADAKKALVEFKPDLIFIDQNLPDGLGINLIGYMKETLPSAKIIMITAQDSLLDKNMALASGANDFIGKPFTADQVKQSISKLMP